MRMIAKEIQAEMDDARSGPPIGFCILLFDFGPGGFCAHATNGNRGDVAKLLREHADRMDAGIASTAGDA